MSRNASRIEELLEQILESQRTPEEVCAEEDPGMLWEVRQRLAQVRRVEAQIDSMFPPSGPLRPFLEVPPASPDVPLPDIAGYAAVSIVARGGMGVIYKARHLKLNRFVALKMLLAGSYASAPELTRFTREAEAVAGLVHCNIVQVYDVGELKGQPYYTMEFVEGGSLAEKLAGVPQPATQSAAMIATLADAIHLAHQRGIIHRDLKPGNILLTPDGTPKITDFGLARHFDGGDGSDSALTIDGIRIGTPSYMSPEQAGGKLSAVGPAADIYALGAILYEMLTGRPPFRAESATETQRQVMSEDPVAPSRLNPKIPRDLETICLTCLRKEPQRRYESAARLADDLRRFLRDEPITARPIGGFERAAKWVRRRPALAAGIALGSMLAAVLIGGGVWMMMQRTELAHAVEADLREVAGLQRQAHWAGARSALDRAEARVGGRPDDGPAQLRRQLDQATADLDLVMKLDDIRLSRATSGQLELYKTKANEKYAAAFRQAGFGQIGDDAGAVATRVQAAAVRPALMAALDDWAMCAHEPAQRDWIVAVAQRADPNSREWRQKIFAAADWDNPAAMSEIARTIPLQGQSLSLLLALGERLRATGAESVPFLQRVQQDHPDDFWANLVVGNALMFRSPAEARGYYRAVLASRPQAAVGYCAVGDALRLQDAFDEAIHYYHTAIDLDPGYARGYTNLGLTLQTQGKLDDAIAKYTKALALDPNYAWTYYNLGNALAATGKSAEARAHYEHGLTLDPKNVQMLNAIRTMRIREGKIEEVWTEWHAIIETNPPGHDAWWGYPELTLFLRKEDDYRRTRQALLKRFGDSIDPLITEKVARACLLIPGSDDEQRMAATLTDRALAVRGASDDWLHPYFMFARGLADYRLGRFDSAGAIMQVGAAKVLGPAPRIVLAMVQHRQGNTAAAQATLAAAEADFDWRESAADNRDTWMCHILRREADAMIRPAAAHNEKSE